MVLLELLTEVTADLPVCLIAAHVWHQLQPVAAHWVDFCREQSAKRRVEFHALTVQLAEPERNIEQQARTLRYQALQQLLRPAGLLLTAHHADDQLETILLALKRGSGLTGLAGIAACQTFGAGALLRPLLPFSRAQLETVASWRGLAFVEDPSNQDLSFDRNFLRQQIIPLLTDRFGAISQTASRSASLLQQSLQFQQQQLDQLLTQVCRADGMLSLRRLGEQPQPEQDLLLHRYLQKAGVQASLLQFQQIRRLFLASRPDAQPEFRLNNMLLRRYDDVLFVDGAIEPIVPQATDMVLDVELYLPTLQCTLCWSRLPLAGWQTLPLAVSADASLQLSFGQLNRRFKPAGQPLSRALKDWCKLWKVPPWQRGILPFIIAGQQKDIIHAVLHPVQLCSQVDAADAQSWLNLRWQLSANARR